MTSKLIKQKSIYADCGAKKSVFVKEYRSNKKQKQFLQVIKTCTFIVKAVKNIHVTRFQKNIILISKNKIKGKSKCAVCLTERSFIHELGDKYGL